MKLRLPHLPRFTRSLRFRLSLIHTFFFGVLLLVLGGFFRQVLELTLSRNIHDVLDEEWAAVKGYLRIEKGLPQWYADPQDPEEAFISERLQRMFLLTDADGTVLQVSSGYRTVGIESPEEIARILQSGKPHWDVRNNSLDVPYMVRSGLMIDAHSSYFMSIARPLDYNQKVLHDFTKNYFTYVPVLILFSGLLGWFTAGRALGPVTEVAAAAQRISSSSLNLQIPLRRSGDELDHLIESFNLMIERLARAFEQMRQFSTDVSHELRTPLTGIRGQLEVALITAKTDEQYRDAIVNSLQDVERLSNIVRALLLLSQSESGQLTLQKIVIDITALVNDMVEEFQIPAEAAGVQLTSSIEPECLAELDRVQVERLIANLLSNALKYTQAGGNVQVRLRSLPLEVVLEVADNGRGIAAGHLPHIFDRFYKVPDPDPEKGLGLGLSFVAWIVKAHGGAVDVQSEEGKGTTFTVRLPKGALPQTATPSPQSPAQVS